MHVSTRQILLSLIFGAVLILAACAGPVPTTTPAAAPTMIPTAGRAATIERADTPTSVSTPTFAPAPTPVPTPTPLATPTPAPTPTSFPTPTPQPTETPRVIPTATHLPSPSPTPGSVPAPTAVPTPTAQATPSTDAQSVDKHVSIGPQDPPRELFLPFRTEDVGGGNEFISPFGIIRHSRDAGHGHGGIDFPLNEDAPVYAVADGTILSAEESSDGAGGFDVKLLILGSGGEGWGFLYEHIELESGISVGSTVTRGQLIGRNGLTTVHRNNHLQFTYMFDDYRFFRDQRCWVDHLDSSSQTTLLDYFDSIKNTETFLAQWRNAGEEGMYAYRELLNRERFPEGPQLCYSLGLDVRVSATLGPAGTATPVPSATSVPTPSPTAVFVTPEPSPAPTTALEVDIDDCGNALGNGGEIVSGPSAPEGNDRDSVFRSLTVHPADPNTVLMGTERNGFVKSIDGGATWTRHRQGLRWLPGIGYPEIYDITISPSDPNIVFAATVDSAGPVTGDFPSSVAGIYKSIDGGETWFRKNCGLTNSRAVAVRFDPGNPDFAVAAVGAGERTFSTGQSEIPLFFDGGIYLTMDGGDSWQRVPTGANDNINNFHTIAVAGSEPATFITFGLHTLQGGSFDPSLNAGFLRSIDGGKSWEPFGPDEVVKSSITHFAASADGSVFYATGDAYHHWVSTDGGSTWARSSLNQGSGPVAVSPADPNIVIFRNSAQTSLFRSSDGLKTYSVVATTDGLSDDPNLRFAFEDVVFAPSDPSIVYAATTGLLVYKSVDGGASFTLLKNIRSEVLNVAP